MKIACLGWGSLIWRPESLQVQNKWFEDGPILPIEFTRLSNDGRITLIIDSGAQPVRVLWALMTTGDLAMSIQSLQEREGAKKNDLIHYVEKNNTDEDAIKSTIISWLQAKNLDAVIWTGLSYSDKTNKERPSIETVIDHLKQLPYQTRKMAEEYIRKAPRQIDTNFRRRIEFEFGWTCIE